MGHKAHLTVKVCHSSCLGILLSIEERDEFQLLVDFPYQAPALRPSWILRTSLSH